MGALGLLEARPGMRLGLMGGTFDPVHLGHLVAAEEALFQFRLDEVLFVPGGIPPHKHLPATPAEVRYAMVDRATRNHPHFWVSRFEVDNDRSGYSVETLAAVRAEMCAGSSLFFITGADAVLELGTWKEPEQVLEQCTVIAASRPGYDLAGLRARVRGVRGAEAIKVMGIPAMGVSSTEIRKRVAEGRSIRYLVPDGVRMMIQRSGLYRESSRESAS